MLSYSIKTVTKNQKWKTYHHHQPKKKKKKPSTNHQKNQDKNQKQTLKKHQEM